MRLLGCCYTVARVPGVIARAFGVVVLFVCKLHY